MSPAFVPLSSANLEKALQLREQLCLHEDLAYQAGSAAQVLRELIANPAFGSFWLIEVDGRTAGYVILTISYSPEFHGLLGVLDELYVDESWRGRGIGTAALDFAERECRSRGLNALRLEVAHSNPRALELYRRAGFFVEPRHVMTKWLAGHIAPGAT
jgi:ribosomal protein S18 acetylase RimI-like enzyme